jgi:nucleoid-associated protein YgaU
MRVLCTTVLLAGGLLFPVFSQKQEMTQDQYLTEFATGYEKPVREKIAGEQARIESLRQQLSQLDQRIAGVIQEKYAILGITEADVNNAEIELSSIKAAFQQSAYLSNEELAARRQEIEQLDTRFNALKAKQVCLLFRVAEKVRDVEPVRSQVLQQLRLAQAAPQKTSPAQASSTYTVGQNAKALSLSQIAGELYGDQYEWPRIYRANKALIDKWYARYKNRVDSLKITRPQDFVLPGWTLEIPR